VFPVRFRATILVVAVLLGAPFGGRARAAPREDARAQGTAPGEPAAQQPQPAPQAPGNGETYVTDGGDFEPEAPSHSIALGPVGRGDMVVSLDLGWLRSGFRADLGLGAWFDLVLRGDALLLYDGFGAQDGIHLGVRVSPMSKGLIRAGAEFSVGQIFAPGEHTVTNLTVLRASATAGLALDLATVYGRGEVRWLSSMKSSGPGWAHDGELGVGLERAFGKRGRFIIGAEGYVWMRPGLESLGQWRLCAGFAI
jgi:hypothetical protein